MGKKIRAAAVVTGVVLLAGAVVAAVGGSPGRPTASERSLARASGAKPPAAAAPGAGGAAPARRTQARPAAEDGASSSPSQGTGPGGLPTPALGAHIVKRAALDIEVAGRNLDGAYSRVLDLVGAAGGFVQSTQQGGGRAELTVRVPAAAFETTMHDLRRIGKVTAENVVGEDVTGQVVDLDARLRNARAQEAVLLDLMRRASSIPDTITVQQQLSQAQQQIEELDGQRRALDDQTTYATIKVQLARPGAPTPQPRSQRSTLAQAWDRAVAASLDVIGGTLVVLGAVLPVAALVAIVGLGARIATRRARRPAAAAR